MKLICSRRGTLSVSITRAGERFSRRRSRVAPGGPGGPGSPAGPGKDERDPPSDITIASGTLSKATLYMSAACRASASSKPRAVTVRSAEMSFRSSPAMVTSL